MWNNFLKINLKTAILFRSGINFQVFFSTNLNVCLVKKEYGLAEKQRQL